MATIYSCYGICTSYHSAELINSRWLFLKLTVSKALAETWRRLGGTEIFEWPFLGTNFHFTPQNFWRPFLDSILSEIWYITYMTPLLLTKNLNFRQKYSSLTPFLSQFVRFITFHNSTFQNIGGWWMHGPSPTSNFGGPSPQFPLKSPPMTARIPPMTSRRYASLLFYHQPYVGGWSTNLAVQRQKSRFG